MFNYEKLLKVTAESANLAVEEKEIDEMTAEIEAEKQVDDALFSVMTESLMEACEMSLNVEAYAETTVSTEAAKDILARKAYAGIAAIKTLIRTVIGWFKRLLGLSSNVKKVFKSLSKKAKAMKKALNKYTAKIAAKVDKDAEDITKEIIDYGDTERGLDAVKAKINEVNGKVTLASNAITHVSGEVSTASTELEVEEEAKVSTEAQQNSSSSGNTTYEIAYTNDNVSNLKDKYKEELPKVDKSLNEIKTILITALGKIEANKDVKDINKDIDKANKALDKAYQAVSKYQKKDDNDTTDTSALAGILSKVVTSLNNCSSVLTAATKEYVKLADNCFTDVKWLMAKVA